MDLASIIKLMSEFLKAYTGINAWKRSRRQKEVESKILRHLKRGQASSHAGAVWYTPELLIEHGVIGRDEHELSIEALLSLCQKGFLDYSEERYYLKGRVPPK
jgi:hypothetical protein